MPQYYPKDLNKLTTGLPAVMQVWLEIFRDKLQLRAVGSELATNMWKQLVDEAWALMSTLSEDEIYTTDQHIVMYETQVEEEDAKLILTTTLTAEDGTRYRVQIELDPFRPEVTGYEYTRI